MNIKIKDFALTGQFGPISIGDKREDIIALFGDPTNEAFYGENGSEITYGWYEFFLDKDNVLHAIQNDHCDFEFSNEHISISPWLIEGERVFKYEEVLATLKADKIAYTEIVKYGRNLIRLNSGFLIDFDEEPENVMLRDISAYLYWPESG